MEFLIQEFDNLESTNTYLKKHFANTKTGTVVCAKVQTGGRGRLGKQFLSPSGMGLYMSVLLRPDSMDESLLLPLYAGIAVARGFASFTDAPVQLKWPNDVLINRRKIVGILGEACADGSVVLGIGINITTPRAFFEQNGLFHVSSFEAETGVNVSREELRAEVLGALSEVLNYPQEKLLALYNEQCATLGKTVTISGGVSGVACGIGLKGELLIRNESGQLTALNSGEVSVSGMY